jgi:heat shock protein HtpX
MGFLILCGVVFALRCSDLCHRFAADKPAHPVWLRPALASLCKRMQLPVPELHSLNTAGINAFALQGLFDHGHILLNSATLTHLHEDEIDAVLAHECSHIANKHAFVMTLIQGMTFPLTLPAAFVVSLLVGIIFGMENFRRMFLALHQLLTVLFFPLTGIGIAFFTRVWEFDADRQAAQIVGVEKYLAALKCLHGSFFQHPNLLNISNDNPRQTGKHSWALSHPSLAQRIHAILEIGQSE